MSSELKESPVLRTLTEDVRAKALEYATMLGARGPRPTTVLGTAVNLAQEWREGRLPTATPAGGQGLALLVQPRQGRWIIRNANSTDASHVFSVRDDAVRRAQELGVENNVPVFVFGPGGTLIERYAAPKAGTIQTSSRSIVPRPAARPAPRPEPRAVAVVAVPPLPEVVETAQVRVADPEPVAAAEAAAVAMVSIIKDGKRWLVCTPEGRREAFTTRKKAVKFASDAAIALGIAFKEG